MQHRCKSHRTARVTTNHVKFCLVKSSRSSGTSSLTVTCHCAGHEDCRCKTKGNNQDNHTNNRHNKRTDHTTTRKTYNYTRLGLCLVNAPVMRTAGARQGGTTTTTTRTTGTTNARTTLHQGKLTTTQPPPTTPVYNNHHYYNHHHHHDGCCYKTILL